LNDLSLWEFNACVRAYNRRRREEGEAELASNWRTANFSGAAFGGKLKNLDNYTGKKATVAPKVTAEQMAKIDKRFKERREANGPDE